MGFEVTCFLRPDRAQSGKLRSCGVPLSVVSSGECEVNVGFRVPVCGRGTPDAVSPDYSSAVASLVRGG